MSSVTDNARAKMLLSYTVKNDDFAPALNLSIASIQVEGS